MAKDEYKKDLIANLVLSAKVLFNVNIKQVKRAATNYVNSNQVSKNDPLVNHGKFGPIVTNMLLKYGLINQQQIEDKIIQAISK